jgi:hypothetical protein
MMSGTPIGHPKETGMDKKAKVPKKPKTSKPKGAAKAS